MAGLLRYASSLAAAALVPAGIAGLLAMNSGLAILVFVVAMAHAVVLGLPAALVLLRKGRESALTALVAGFLIGALPLGLFFALSQPADFSSVGGVPTSVQGIRTASGWIGIVQTAATLGVLGAIGGLSAWLCWKLTRQNAWISIGVVAAMVACLFALPVLSADRSCHNPMQDGRTSIGSELNAHIPLGREDWPILAQVFEDFADTHQWSFRDDSGRYSVPAISLSVCAVEGTQITAMRQVWSNEPDFMNERGVSIGVYQPQGGNSWERPTQELLLSIEQRWPGRLGFTNERGQDIEPPDFLGRTAVTGQAEAP